MPLCPTRIGLIRIGAICFALLSLPGSIAAEQARPNFLVILADDLGYGDLGCYGHPEIQTPRIDQLAKQGLRLTSCYAAAANCSPSRTGLMTGRTPWRVGVHNWIPMLSPMHVPESEVTIATLLKHSGYQTGQFGKWHLNGMFNLPGQPQADDHGFEHWFATQNNALPNHKNPWNFVRNDIPVGPQKGFAAELVAAETVRWLEHSRDETKPFFAFVCFHEPHEPIASSDISMQPYAHLDDPSQRAHHGNVTQLDMGVGKILDALERLNLAESTLVLFTSDNGPAITRYHPHGSSGPLRAKKGHIYEGGLRVPGIVRWPGVVEPQTVSDEPIIGTDLLPTLCELSQTALPDDRPLDGASFAAVLTDPEAQIERQRPLYWHFLRARSDVKVAIRDGDWKLTATVADLELPRCCDLTTQENKQNKAAQLNEFFLYNLAEDIGEQVDVKQLHPDRFEQMRTTLIDYYREVRDESPAWPEWEFPRYEAERIEWPDYENQRRSP